MTRCAGIYERRGFLFIHADLQTEDGLWIARGPCIKLASNASPSQIGDVVLQALSRSGAIIPHPTEWKSVDEDNPVLEAAGIKRWHTFMKGARCVSVSLDENGLVLTPNVNLGGRGGFQSVPDDVILPSTANAVDVGEAVAQALAMCK